MAGRPGGLARKEPGRDETPAVPPPRSNGIAARQQPYHRRFARAVGTHQRDSRAALDFEAHAVVDRQLAVALDRAAQFDDAPRTALARRKRDRGRLFEARGRLQPFDLFELLDTALDELGLARLVAKAADEG